MTSKELVLAIVPPALAIIAQLCSFPTEAQLEALARKLSDDGGLSDAATFLISKTAKGATSIAGIVPTLIAVVTACVAIASPETNGLIYAAFCVAFCIGFSLILFYFVSQRNLYEIAVDRLPSPLRFLGCRPFLSLNYSRLIDYALCFINGALIVFAILVFKDLLPHFI